MAALSAAPGAAGSSENVVWNARTGQRHRILTVEKGQVEALALSADRKRLAVIAHDLKPWNLVLRSSRVEWANDHLGSAHAAVFSPDGQEPAVVPASR